MFRLVAIDLDGTTLNSHHELSEKTISTLRKVNEAGITIAIATGRSISAVLQILKILQLSQKKTPVICYNGAFGSFFHEVDGSYQSELIFHDPLPPSYVDQILNFSDSKGCVAQYYHAETGDVFAAPKSAEHFTLLKRYEELVGRAQIMVENYEDPIRKAPPAKILILTPNPDEIISHARSSLPEDLTIFRGSPDPFFVEILNFSVTKGGGLQRMCDFLGIGIHEVAAFGDGDNDKEMLELAGYSCAPSNAKIVAKNAAKKVSLLSNDDDYVAVELENLFLRKD